jgi:predicted Zn-dependent peptidase
MPDPVTERADYLAHLVLAALLGQGRHALLRRGPTAAAGASSLSVGCGLFGLPLDTVGPDLLTLFAVHEHERGAEHVLDALDGTLEALATNEVAAGQLRATTARWAAGAMRDLGDPGTRAQLLGLRETLFGEAELTHALPELVRVGVTGEQVSRAAARLRSSHRAVVRFVPGRQAAPRDIARETTA